MDWIQTHQEHFVQILSTTKHNGNSLMYHQSFAIAKSQVFTYVIMPTLTYFSFKQQDNQMSTLVYVCTIKHKNTMYSGNGIIYTLQSFGGIFCWNHITTIIILHTKAYHCKEHYQHEEHYQSTANYSIQWFLLLLLLFLFLLFTFFWVWRILETPT